VTFYVELDADEYGNTALPHAVLEGTIVQGGPASYPYTNPSRRALLITGPPELTRHAGMYTDSYGGFAEVPGPARMITSEERAQLARGRKPA
jgi:hypothetical protein